MKLITSRAEAYFGEKKDTLYHFNFAFTSRSKSFLRKSRLLSYTIIIYLSDTTCAMIGRFIEPYFPVRPSKFKDLFKLKFPPSILTRR